MQIKTQIEKYIKNYSDDKTQNQAMRLAFLFTLIIWLIFFVILAVSPGWNQKKKYKTVQISLVPVEKPKPEEKLKPEQKIVASPKASENSKQVETAKKTEAPKQTHVEKKSQDAKLKTSDPQKTNSSSVPKKTENSQATQKKVEKTENSAKPAASEQKKANIKYGKSVDELLNEQNNSVSKSKNFDWDSIDFAENTNSSGSGKNSSVQNAQKLNNAASLSGTAGTKTDAGGRISSETQKSSAKTSASSSTLSQLGAISDTEFSSTAAAGLDSIAKGINQHLNGKYSIKMTDGSPRILVFPAEPRLRISEENSKTIDNTKNLTITLKILADGTVPLGGISFSPASSIDSSVRSELAAQIQTWRFSSSYSDGQASFYYSIIKR